MTAEEYRALCSRGDVLARSVLETSRQVLGQSHPDLAALVRTVLGQAPIEKPPLHKGGELSDHFLVQLSTEQVTDIVTGFGWLEADGDARAGDLLDAWNRIVWYRHDAA